MSDHERRSPAVAVRLLGPGDAGVLSRCAQGVFDDPIDWERTREFLADRRHHLAVAIASEGQLVVGMVSAVSYLHPDKPHPELWINEVAVAPGYRRLGIGRRMLDATFAAARAAGCREAWVLTKRDNAAAIALYRGAGGHPDEQVLMAFNLETEPAKQG